MRQERIFRDRQNLLGTLSDAELHSAFCLHRQELLSLCDDMADEPSLANRQVVASPIMQVFYILMFSVFMF